MVLRAHIVRVILGAGAFDWAATRLVAAALALFVLSLLAQSVSLLIARAYYAAGNTIKPLILAVIEVAVSVASALALVVVFSTYPFFRSFIEALLRVEDVPGTIVLMLALGLTAGPWAVALGDIGLFGFLSMMLFLAILVVGFIYEWKKGALEWE
jgi:peptidoglycan biosynthesis protein MviN/MurJ (putative lipid II flippase)